MEEKLEELLGYAEYEVEELGIKIQELKHRIRFLETHGFHIEKKWVERELEGINVPYLKWKNHTEKIRELLDKWNQ